MFEPQIKTFEIDSKTGIFARIFEVNPSRVVLAITDSSDRIISNAEFSTLQDAASAVALYLGAVDITAKNYCANVKFTDFCKGVLVEELQNQGWHLENYLDHFN